jgi:hypothetical protein
MNRSLIIWLIALIFTLLLAAFQRMTGPTYPVSGKVEFNNEIAEYEFDRSHGGEGDHTVQITNDDAGLQAELFWKRYKTKDEWTRVKMIRKDNMLTANLPHQPKAGKLLYKIKLINQAVSIVIPENPVLIRFKGAVPAFILIPHIIFIFGAMLLSTRTGLEIFNKEPKFKNLTILTLLFLFLGGGIFGPITQYYAFDAFWTGFPVGYDLTDNKVLIAVLGWIIAAVMIKKSPNPKRWIAFASILLFAVFLIPHSVLGSELDYNKLDEQQRKTQKIEAPLD